MNPIRTLVAAIDLSSTTSEVLASARLMAEASSARVHVVHVVHDLSKYMGFYVGVESVGELQATLESEAREKTMAAVTAAFGADHQVEVKVLRGTPFSDLVAEVESIGAGLLIVGAHGRSKPEHKIFGSTAERLIKNSPCPVLVVGQHSAC